LGGAAIAGGGGFGDVSADGIADFAHEVDEFHLSDVQGFDFEVGGELGLEGFELVALGVGDGHALFFLAGEGHDLAVEFIEEAAGVGVFCEDFLGLLIAADGGVLGDESSELVGGIKDLLRINGHDVPSVAIQYVRADQTAPLSPAWASEL